MKGAVISRLFKKQVQQDAWILPVSAAHAMVTKADGEWTRGSGAGWRRVCARQIPGMENEGTYSTVIDVEECAEDEATLVSSKISGTDLHGPVIDLDFPCRLVPSSTPGHFHLYMERAITWADYVKVLDALVEAGLVENGFLRSALKRGATYVRRPGVQKGWPLSKAPKFVGTYEELLESRRMAAEMSDDSKSLH